MRRIASNVCSTHPVPAEQKKDGKLNQGKAVVNRIRQADPTAVSTTTTPSPVGEPQERFPPKGPSVKPKEVPAPKIESEKKPKGDCHPALGWRTKQALGCD